MGPGQPVTYAGGRERVVKERRGEGKDWRWLHARAKECDEAGKALLLVAWQKKG